MSQHAWLDAALVAARPQALAALLRYFRDLDLAEEAFQDASLKALGAWSKNGPPRDPASWLVMVGRNAGLDQTRRRARLAPLPKRDPIDDEDPEATLAERLDTADYRDDVLRLLFICCHPELPQTQQVALALRVVSGLTTPQIARAFLVSDAAMEQRITRAKQKIAAHPVAFEAPDAAQRAERVAIVMAMIYLVFNEGYSAAGERATLCDEAIRLGRLLLRLYPSEPEVMGLLALMLLQHARLDARFDAQGELVLLEDQDRTRWRAVPIAEGFALIDKALRHQQDGQYLVQAALAAVHARAPRWEDTDWAAIERLYQLLEGIAPSPVVTLNRAVALAKVEGAAVALALIEPLAAQLTNYFYFHGARGALLLQLGRPAEARVAFDQAIARASSLAEANHIRAQIDRLTR